PVLDWRWSLIEVPFAGSIILPVTFVFLHETLRATLLLQRARRLRRVMGNSAFVSLSKTAQHDMSSRDILMDALIKLREITIGNSAIMFAQLYTAAVYAKHYSPFESSPLVFLATLVACLNGATLYALYICFYMNPRIRAVVKPAP
ncbi:hypothetical protein F4782DRAFT_548178, partial [Xylaria castorea]